MARGKKKEAVLTPEDRLQAALVPEGEQPYKVPENWCWVKFGAVCRFENGFAFKSDYFSKNSGVPVVRISNIVNNSITLEDCVLSTETDIDDKYVIQQGDLLIAMSGATTGKNGIYNSEKVAYLNQRVGNIKVINKSILYDIFRNYYVLNIEREILNAAYGGAQPNISSNMICKMNFPLPPLAEQQRIVTRIENLFAKLDEAKEKAQAVVDGFEMRRAAILHRAFTGELTARWRNKHQINLDNWKNSCLGDITDIISSKRIYKEEYVTEGIPFFRSSEIVDLHDYGETVPTFFISEQRYNEIKSQYGVPNVGDLLVTSVGTIGKTWLVDGRKFYYKDGNLTQVKKCKSLNMRFLQYYIKSGSFKEQVFDTVAGSAYNALTIVKFKRIIIPVPDILEQSEIVRILDSLLAKEQRAKEAAEAVLERIELIKKAILARAFRGELGTNEPGEESAVEMLKRHICNGGETNAI